jgi:predicted RecB family nuclease
MPPTKITRDVLESYLSCKYKAHLKLAGQQGARCDYESLLSGVRGEVKARTAKALRARHAESLIASNVPLTPEVLGKGWLVILDASLEADELSILFDGLERKDGRSKIGDFHYLPVLCHEGRKVRKNTKVLLAIYGLLLEQIQGTAPRYGVVWHGPECTGTRVHLSGHRQTAQRILAGMLEMARSESPPGLILNDHCPVCEFRGACHARAVQDDNLSLLLGMGEKEIRAYNRKGYFTVTQLSHTFRYRKPRKRARNHSYPHYYSLQARAIRTGLVHLHGLPSIPSPQTRVYIDIEGVPDRDFCYLIGVLVESGPDLDYHQFWADRDEDQDGPFLRFAEFVGSLPADCRLFHYGSYEATALRRACERQPTELQDSLRAAIAKLVNVLAIVHRHVYFPTYSNSLKEIGRFLGCQWANSNASGIQSLYWREMWERTNDPAIKDELIQYNRDDCPALRSICAFLLQAEAAGAKPESPDGSAPSIVSTSDLPKPARKWPFFGRISFTLDDLARVNECAYFDYQRERVYVRTDKRFRQINKRTKPPRVAVTPNKRAVIDCSTCPHCGSSRIRRRNRLTRRTVDLRFHRGGVKRWVVVHRSWAYRCEDCGTRFWPPEWVKNRSVYQPGLACWCVYQNVECKQNMWQVRTSLKDVFGLDVPTRQLYLFKGWVASRYAGLYEEIRRAILGGHLVHADETTVNLLNNGKGYVWVLAAMDKVYFFYKPSREGTFLNELLAGFRGVLVSDFFSAYESVDCLQQKCLLHFLRDINDDLQRNPFDAEFKEFAQEFAGLLRQIVETADRHGLAKRFLARHIPAARRFEDRVSAASFSSEVMLGYQKRVRKAAGRLFTFLEHDDVPWNNNNAEHAMKVFAKFRQLGDGKFSERSLEETLLLLSVCQTCHFNGVNVLRYLLSGKRDLASVLTGACGKAGEPIAVGRWDD